jgi:hypothetical protein
MYQRGEQVRTAQARGDAAPDPTPEAAARLALARVRKLLEAYTPGMPCNRPQLQAALAAPLNDPAAETERLFAAGWLAWLEGNPAAAEPLLEEAVVRARATGTTALLPQAAYWATRVRLRRGRLEAFAEYDEVLRTLGGAAQATAWLIDLLWRAGRVDRAEQVWKSLRANRKVSACPEGPLLEARVLLRRGELAAAERVLNEGVPTSGVVWVERQLLLAWVAFTGKQSDRGWALLEHARAGPYPAGALDTWARLCERRSRGAGLDAGEVGAPPALEDYLRGQQARLAGEAEAAAAAYRAALASPAAQPFARYGLACLGQEDPAAVLQAQPGLFVAVRCRARLALERFRSRQTSPADCLDALQQAAAAGYKDPAGEHLRRLALALSQRQPATESLRQLAAEGGPGAADRRRAALELATRRLGAAEARALLAEWAQKGGPMAAGSDKVVGRQLLRLLLAEKTLEPGALAALRGVLAGDPLLCLVDPQEPMPGADRAPAIVRLLALARELAGGLAGALGESWRQEVCGLRSQDRLRALAQALLLQEAAARQDVAAVAGLLEDADPWRRFPSAPPRFVLAALAALVPSQPAHPAWRRTVGRWLALWDAAALGEEGPKLAAAAGLTSLAATGAEPPPGVPAVAWLLHQAARAVGRDDAALALAFARRAIAADPELATPDNDSPGARALRDVLPELQRRARAQALSVALAPPGDETPSALLADAVDLLAATPAGQALLEAADRGDHAAAQQAVAALADQADVPPRLAHHLALLQQGSATALEKLGRPEEAEPHWRCAWRCWLRFLAAPPAADGPPSEEARGLLLGELLTRHRHQLGHLLACEAMDPARRLWALVRQLPGEAPEGPLREDLAGRVERFRDELATEYLLATREVMHCGTVAEGLRANYEQGLARLRRLLSLDRGNVRLLAALVEECTEWFLDLYHQGDAPALRRQVDRFTPFALQLARYVEERPGDLAARAALADFWKFRGFVCADPEQKAGLYREALRFNPANDNVRQLLADLQPSQE